MLRPLVRTLLSAFELCLIVRALLSWIPTRIEWLDSFLYQVTEPVLRPFRNWFMKIDWARSLPIDISFLVLFLLVQMIQTLI